MVGVSQRGCRRVHKGLGHLESACNHLLPGWLPEAVAGWEPVEAVGSGFPQPDKNWIQGLPLEWAVE